ncbi:hypothetical protein NL676_002710 [Syzygium grande]|nr:hypothetical protein NL676_002710 [Syzygium grande]
MHSLREAQNSVTLPFRILHPVARKPNHHSAKFVSGTWTSPMCLSPDITPSWNRSTCKKAWPRSQREIFPESNRSSCFRSRLPSHSLTIGDRCCQFWPSLRIDLKPSPPVVPLEARLLLSSPPIMTPPIYVPGELLFDPN